MNVLSVLGPKAATLARFIAERAQASNTRYVITGASALIMQGIIRRETKDLDVNIEPDKAPIMQAAIKPFLDSNKNEAVLVDGKTPQDKAKQKKFRVYKSFDGLPQTENMKVDISESSCVLVPGAYIEMDGITIASVPLIVVFKICSLARANRSAFSANQRKDLGDLLQASEWLIAHHAVVPREVQALFALENPPFTWAAFWEQVAKIYNKEALAQLDCTLSTIGIKASLFFTIRHAV